MSQRKKPFLTILILVAATRKTTIQRCVNSVLSSSYKQYEIVVINNSKDETFLNEVKKTQQDVRTITLHTNVGVAGYNAGFLLAKGDAVLVLDDDCEIFPDSLEKIAHTLRTLPKTVGVLATNVINPMTHTYHYNQTYVGRKQLFTFPGGASVFRTDMLKKVGMYDPLFFLWLHEDDLAIRMLDQKFTIHFASDIYIHHYHEAKGFRPTLAFFVFRNKAWFNIKHFSYFFFPALIFRDFLWLLLFPFRTQSVRSFFIGGYGYLMGYLTYITPLLNRHVVHKELQKQFLSFYYSYRG